MGCVHLWLIKVLLLIIVPALRTILCSCKTSLDFLVNLGHHLCQLHYELILVFSFVALPFSVIGVLSLQEIIMPFFAWTNVCLCVREKIIWTEGEEIELANILIIEVVSTGETNKKWFISVFSHELVELLPDMIHFNQLCLFINN